jgi:hypothetical protein
MILSFQDWAKVDTHVAFVWQRQQKAQIHIQQKLYKKNIPISFCPGTILTSLNPGNLY